MSICHSHKANTLFTTWKPKNSFEELKKMRAAVHWQNYFDSTVKSNTYNILDTDLKYIKIKNSCILKIMLKAWKPTA